MRTQTSAQKLPFDGIDLDQLDRFLRSDHAPPNCMMLSELDGFLWGIAVGPVPVSPGEWMPLVWGGEAPTFTDLEEAQAIHDLIAIRHTEIVRNLRHDMVDPIFWTDRDNRITGADWAEGFRQAIRLRGSAWKPLLTSERDRYLLVPMFALCLDGDPTTGLGLPPDQAQRLTEEAIEIIPSSVNKIAAYWRENGRKRTSMPIASRPPLPQSVRAATKVGRNDPCPCGSANKFKRCCGRNP
jgi:uncharacterized protein